MGKSFIDTMLSTYIVYLYANNLYGWAMSEPLPTHGFKWMAVSELETWENHSCILEVVLKYPKSLHDLHSDYPLAPERVEVNKVSKLIPNLGNKKKYILHYENLKQYLSLGLIEWCFTPLLTVFQSYHGDSSHYSCFPGFHQH